MHQVLVEKSIKGYKEIEYEVMRDANDTAITICNMENVDPVGIHTGDSIVVCPSQTLTNKEYHMLRDSALKIIRALQNRGRLQRAVRAGSAFVPVLPDRGQSARVALVGAGVEGQRLPDRARIRQNRRRDARWTKFRWPTRRAAFEPTLDYVVTKMPRFPFDKFTDASNRLSTQMKATGEVMSHWPHH